MTMGKPNFFFHFMMLPILLLVVVFDISNSAPTTALALRKVSGEIEDHFGGEKAAELDKAKPKADWMKNDFRGKGGMADEKEMDDGMESGQRSPSSSVGGIGAENDEFEKGGEAEEQNFNNAKLGGKAGQLGDDARNNKKLGYFGSGQLGDDANNNKKSKPFGFDAKDKDGRKSSFANEDDHFGGDDDFLRGKSLTKGRVDTLEGKYPMKGGPVEEQDQMMEGRGMKGEESGFPLDDHKEIGLTKGEGKKGQPEGQMEGLSGKSEGKEPMKEEKEEGSQMAGEGQLNGEEEQRMYQPMRAQKMESPMDVDEKKLKRKMDEEAGRMDMPEAQENPIGKKRLQKSNWDWDEPKVKDEGVQTKDDWEMNKYGQSGDNEVHDEFGSNDESAFKQPFGQIGEEHKEKKTDDEKEKEEKLGKEEKHMTLGKEEMMEVKGKDEKMKEENEREEEGKEDELKEEEEKTGRKNEGDVKGDYGKPEEEEGKNDKKDGEEEEEEEEEDPKFFKIYPFLHGASPQSIKVFRDLLKDQQLSKAQLDVKRKEWAEQQPKDIQTSFSAWKQHLDEKKKKRVEKIELELPTLAKGTQQLYFEIKAVIANQTISRHQECGQIRDFVNAVDEKVRNEFKEKAETRVVKFCMEEEEPELAANGDAEHHTAEEHATEGDEKKKPIEELDGEPKALEEGTAGTEEEVGAGAGPKVGNEQPKENVNADQNMDEKTMDENMDQKHQQEKTEEGSHVDHFEEPKDTMMFPAPSSPSC